MNLISWLKEFIPRMEETDFFNAGFHGDTYLTSIVSTLSKDTDIFIETGTNVGSTLVYMAKSFPDIHCYSCEPNFRAYLQAVKNSKALKNVTVFNLDSITFFNQIMEKNLCHQKPLFWLDAHGQGYKWPLKEEIRIITNYFPEAYILIDDFQVPNYPQFKFDKYRGQICSFDYIKDSLNPDRKYVVIYPSYEEKTSKHHPLTGWVIISLGKSRIEANIIDHIDDISISSY